MQPVRLAWAVVPDGAPRRSLAWDLLREMLPAGADLSNPCARCGGPHGRVTTPGFALSVTYAGGFAVVAVAAERDVAALGVDAADAIDRSAGALVPGVAGTARDWTRIEAALKADGRGLRVAPEAVRVTLRDDGWTADVPGGGSFEGWDAAGPPGLAVSVAVRAA